MNKDEMIQKALKKDIDLSPKEYAEKMKQADKATKAHGVEGKAPLTESVRERRMRMNYYGTMINIGMSILAAVDELNNNLKILNNIIVLLSGGDASANESNAASGD